MISALAIHEAGHAVVGRKLGMLCGHASIVEDDDSAGHSITADPYAIQYHWDRCGHFREFRSVLSGRVMTFMAGREAEIEIIGSGAGGDGDDVHQIGSMLAEVADHEEEQARIEARLRRGARMIVRRHRRLIEEVARALDQSLVIAADELDRLSPGPVRAPLEEPACEATSILRPVSA